MPKKRLDVLLVERGLVETRAKAQALVMAGEVRVDGEVEYKPSALVDAEAPLDLEAAPRFVSRGGEKLEAALKRFPVQVAGRVCADVGASTGGFTDCLLQRGAARVYAIDVGKGLLHWKLRSDPRVVVMEETNARYLERLPEPVALVTVDASFISLKLLLPVIKGWFDFSSPSPPSFEGEQSERGEIIALIKPQFEAGRKEAAQHKGVIRNPAVHRAVLTEVLTFAQRQGFVVRGLLRSPILGPKGNVEFLAWLTLEGCPEEDLASLIGQALPGATEVDSP
ncbi:MAG: TlyA family RNA methyltransferase [Anaerolineales bacterium]|nr:TlyA family RNA methyltransferase [Anaerolineales bacterium]MCX7608218.1 TlyA family RNA methyltransferase [Anaerolineales bacterium]MDW8227039.1 TlyA family RNA methyltransferase [Anaerolineales bacterium]